MRFVILLISVFIGPPAIAGQFDADIVLLGEFHDNPVHHEMQAQIVGDLQPSALVFEMLTPSQASAHDPDLDALALETALQWKDSGWPDFAMYYPIFAAASAARVFGAAVPRTVARAAMSEGVAAAFGDGADIFGLNTPLQPAEQTARESLQMTAHCDALPTEMLPTMVSIQRLRDAELARTALYAFEQTGGPVVVVTGNGHARTDWGIPVYLTRAAPDLSVISLGQSEAGAPLQGTFDVVIDAPAVNRSDPCDAFKTKN